VRTRSMVELLTVFAAVQLDASLWERLPMFRNRECAADDTPTVSTAASFHFT
jgi:hypothetical protein